MIFILVILIFFGLELVKVKWLRFTLFLLITLIGIGVSFNQGYRTGDATARGYAAREMQEVIEIVNESSLTNSALELRAKLNLLKADIPGVLIENNRMPLLNDLGIAK